MTQMRVCDVCTRHVFASEKVCPFCNAELGEAPQRTLSQRVRKGMSRAQLLAVAAAVTGQSLAGCSEESMPIMTMPLYGGPILPIGGEGGQGGDGMGGAGGRAGTSGDAGAGGTSGIGVSGGVGGAGNGGEAGDFAQPVYGAPVEDAGIDDAAVDGDAGDDSGEPMIMPLYGASPPEQ